MASKFASYVKHRLFPILCADCKIKVARKLGFKSMARKIKHHAKRAGSKTKHHLRAGIHHVRIRGKMRKVKVLSNGKWRFMKG